MSAGDFDEGKYETDAGVVVNVRNQPETAALALAGGGTNAAPAGAVAVNFPSAIVGGSRRSIGIHTRGVRIRFTGAVPAGYKAGTSIFLPVFLKAVWDGTGRGDTGTYLGVPVKVLSKVPEAIR